MSTYNRVVMMGRLTRDPEVRHLQKGTPVCQMSVAVNDYTRSAEGERVAKPCFVDVEAWNDQATNCGKYLAKGRLVLVEGRLQMDTWESKEGERRTKLKVRAQHVIFLGGGAEGEGRAGGNGDGAGKRAAGLRTAGNETADGARRQPAEDANMPF